VSDDWLEVHVSVPKNQTDAHEAWLFTAGALSVTLRDSRDDESLTHAVLEPAPGEVRLWDEVTLTGLFAQLSDVTTLHHALQVAATDHGLQNSPYALKALKDRSWERAWMDSFHPMQFGDRFWICPTQSDVIDPAAITLRLDPGLAFGTGTHPTTALCLRWLGRQTDRSLEPLLDKTVIDYGCGSGVLAIASALLGAEHAWAVDIDEQALTATHSNAQGNGVIERLSIGQPSLVDNQRADLVFANILLSPLLDLEDKLAQCVKPAGHLVISGILENQIEPLYMRYNKRFEFYQTQTIDGWVLLAAQRRTH
jgi:ribosomal protein L11 methyltransferase